MKIFKGKLSLIILVLGVAVIFSFSVGGVFLGSLILLSGFMIWRFSNKEDRKFLAFIFISGIAVRIIIYFMYTNISILSGKGGWLIGDGWGTYTTALTYMQTMKGNKDYLTENMNGKIYYMFYNNICYSADDYNSTSLISYEDIIRSVVYEKYIFNGFIKLLGYLFYIFGPLKYSGRLINILFGTLSGIFVYYIVKRIFGQKSAKISAVLVTLFPSMFIWSLDFMKDPLYILMSIIILWSFMMYWDKKNILYIVLIFIAVIIQTTIRKDLWFIGLIPFGLGFYLFLKPSLMKIIFIIVAIGIAAVFFMNKGINYTYIRTTMSSALQNQVGHVNTSYGKGGYAYKLLDDKYYTPVNYTISNITWREIVKAFLKGWYHFLFEPFVWDIKSKSMLMSFPQMILWYLLIIFAIVGMFFGLRYSYKYTLIMTTYIFMLSSVIALSSGNIGTLFRHRDMVTSFYLIFSAVGIAHLSGAVQNNSIKKGVNRN